MTALLDADVIVYKSIFPASTSVNWDGEVGGEIQMNNLPAAKKLAADIVKQWTLKAKKKRALLVFSDRSKPMASFRHLIHPSYKSKRPDEKPPMWAEVHDFLTVNWKSHFIKDLEGDDTMGILATVNPKYTMVTIDKDMTTLPARMVNPDKVDELGNGQIPRKIRVVEADRNWMFQTITGDTVDNYKGAPGAGDKRASLALAGLTNINEMYVSARNVFREQFDKPSMHSKFVHDDPDVEFVMNARCARILRGGDYNQKDHTVRLWHYDPELVTWIDPYYKVPEDIDHVVG